MKIQLCSFGCDRAGCGNKSTPEPTFTAARKTAEVDGWFIRPSDSQPEHVCQKCIVGALSALVAGQDELPVAKS